MIAQKGSTLIIVLVVLLLVTIIGAVAVKSSILGLGIATNSQVNALLLENSDAALFNLENPNGLETQVTSDGMFGYFRAAGEDDELVFCYRASKTEFFDMDRASVIEKDGTITKNGVDGYCTSTRFATGRNAVLSQVYIKKNVTPSPPLSNMPKGTSMGEGKVEVLNIPVSATVISVLPSFSDASGEEIRDCFRLTAIKKTEDTQTVQECFAGLDIPYNVQHGDYSVMAPPELVS